MKITNISALEILDSRGNWTLETSLTIDGSFSGTASVPSGASVGSYEKRAAPARTAVAAINGLLGPRLQKEDFDSQGSLDNLLIALDTTEDRSCLGANTMLSISLAFCKAAAVKSGLPLYKHINRSFGAGRNLVLPQPIFNIVNGGRHAKNDLDFQEFIIIPRGKGSWHSSLEQAETIFQTMGSLLENNGFTTELGDEGGYAPHSISYEGVLNFITKACTQSGYNPGKNVFLGLDIAASTLALGDLYFLERTGVKYNSTELLNLFKDLLIRYPIIYLEDPFGQDNFTDFRLLKSGLFGRVEIVGDDLVTTNTKRLQQAIDEKAISAVIVKPNQIGTLTETFNLVELAKKNSISVITSHRSGETDDSFIADLAVGIGSDYIKAGAPARGERVAKYNRILEIEQELNLK
jgi:enolase